VFGPGDAEGPEPDVGVAQLVGRAVGDDRAIEQAQPGAGGGGSGEVVGGHELGAALVPELGEQAGEDRLGGHVQPGERLVEQ
jgi:hypothetical protein